MLLCDHEQYYLFHYIYQLFLINYMNLLHEYLDLDGVSLFLFQTDLNH